MTLVRFTNVPWHFEKVNCYISGKNLSYIDSLRFGFSSKISNFQVSVSNSKIKLNLLTARRNAESLDV